MMQSMQRFGLGLSGFRIPRFAPRPFVLVAACGLLCGIDGALAASRFVNPANPAAVDAGQGTAAQPWRTIGFAMSQLQPGDRLQIAAGTYREALLFPEWPTALGTLNTVIEGQGKVLIKGSVVVDSWMPAGNGRFVTPWPKETAQVFIDGVALQQIGGRILAGVPTAKQWAGRVAGDQDSMPLNSFYFQDQAAGGRLYLRTALPTLAGHTVEVSTLAHAVIGKKLANVTLRNLEFMHGNTSNTDRNGLVLMDGNKLWLDRIKVSQTDTIGIEMDGDDNKLTDSSSNDNGQLGLKARGNRVQISRTETSRNNLRRFLKWNESGGAKFVGAQGLRNSVLRDHKAIGNFGDGVWFDWGNHNNRIERGTFAFNTGFGIHYEASRGAVIVDNVAVGNGQRGIYLPHSSDSVIAFNLVAGNQLQGIAIVDEGARDASGVLNLQPLGNKVFGNLVASNKGALVLPFDLQTNRANWNAYFGTGADTNWSLGWGLTIHTLPEWVAKSAQDGASSYTPQATDPGAAGAAGQNPSPYLSWARGWRTAAPALAVDPAWLRLLPGGRTDTRAGPAL